MIRGVVVGFGRMGLTHFSILNGHPDVEFAAVCDSSSFMLKNVANSLGIATYKDYGKMLTETRPDFALIATPTAMHGDAIQCAAENGVHMFVEKPFSLNPEQGKRVLDSVNDGTLVNQVGYVCRFNDVFLQIKELLDKRALGELLVFKMEMNGPTLLKDAKSGWRSKKAEGGGCLYDFASHAIDLVNYLIGVPDRVIGTVLQSIHSIGVEDAVCSTFVYKSGLRGNLLCNWSDASYRKPAYRFELLGRKGKVIADLHAYKAFFKSDPAIDGFTEGWNQKYVTDFVKPVRFYVRGFEFTRQLDYFVERVKYHQPAEMCTCEHGYLTDVLIDRIRKNGETGEEA
ncbi:MAG: Gfo/Idh/MocA family protein [Pirellulaceae bacterium]